MKKKPEKEKPIVLARNQRTHFFKPGSEAAKIMEGSTKAPRGEKKTKGTGAAR